MADDTSTYRVSVTFDIEATGPILAAQRAYSLLNDMTPKVYQVVNSRTELEQQVELTDKEAEEALQLAFQGNLFPKE